MMCLDNLKPIHRFSSVVQPEGWTVPPVVPIEQDLADDYGITESQMAVMLAWYSKRATTMISHGTTFAHRMIKILGSRCWPGEYIDRWKKIEKFCTMQQTKNILKIEGKRGYKFPSLAESYYFFMKKYLKEPASSWDRLEATVEIYRSIR